MSTLQIGRYRGGNAASVPGTNSFDEVANIAGLSDPALPQQLRRVRSHGILHRTINSGATWLPVSMQVDVATNAGLAGLTEMLDGQYCLVRDTGWLWRFTTVDGWAAIDDRTGGVSSAVVNFDADVANVAAMIAFALPVGQQAFRLRLVSNGLYYRTLNGGTIWAPVSMRCEVLDNAELAALTEMEENQLVHVLTGNFLWQWTAALGWVLIDDRT